MTEIMLAGTPAGWTTVRLGQVFRERKEKVSDKYYPPLSVTKLGVVPQLETAAKTDDGDNRKLVRTGDFVINSRSDRKGSGGLSDRDGSVSLINIVLEPTGIEPRFAHHLLRSIGFQEEFYRWGHGIVADLWTTRFFDMKNIRLAVPSVDEQRKIAAFLDHEIRRIDLLIARKKKLIDTVTAKEEALCVRALTQGVDGKGQIEETSCEWLPTKREGWPLRRLTHLVRLLSGYAFSSSEFVRGDVNLPELVTPGSFNPNGGLYSKGDRSVFYSGAIPARFKLQVGDMVVAMTDLSYRKLILGRCEFVERDGLLLNQRIAKVISISEDLDKRFLRYSMNSLPSREQVKITSVGATVFHSSSEKIRRTTICLPPLDHQRRISDYLDLELSRTGALKRTINTSIELLEEQRATLTLAAVTGRTYENAPSSKLREEIAA